jgi:MFS family permease
MTLQSGPTVDKHMKYAQPNISKSPVNTWFPWLICGLAAVFYAYEYLLRITPSVMTTELMQTYSINAEQFGNLIAFYYYAYAPSQFIVGVMMDRYGPRRMLTLACLICAMGTYLFASSTHLGVVALGRFLVGFGSAFAFVGVLKLATIWLPPGRFAMVSGLTSALGTVGAMFGGILMTDLVLSIGWRTTTLGSAALGIVLAIVLILFVRDGSKEAHDLDAKQRIRLPHILKNLGRMLVAPQMWINGFIGCLLYLPTTAFAELWGHPYFQNRLWLQPSRRSDSCFSNFLRFHCWRTNKWLALG